MNADPKHWRQVSGAWLGIGTSPGSLLLGALMAARHGGAVPIFSFILSYGLMFAILWYQGMLGLAPPHGEGKRLNELTPEYFGPLMQRITASLIALGMIGWSGFNIALGGAALGRLLNLPVWVCALVLTVPVLVLSLKGIHSWNGLAALATISVLFLTGLIYARGDLAQLPVRLFPDDFGKMVTDVAILVGYISVFSVRSPDFTVGLKSKTDLWILVNLMCLPVLAVVLAGAGLYMGTGQLDLVGMLAAYGGLGLGNLLIFLSVIAPSFTTLYSGAPALKASIGLSEKTGMWVVAVSGFLLAVFRFDLWLGSWLSILAALLPPMVLPLAVESTRRRRGASRRLVPLWTWIPGSMIGLAMWAIWRHPFAPLVGLAFAAILTLCWVFCSAGVSRLPGSVPG